MFNTQGKWDLIDKITKTLNHMPNFRDQRFPGTRYKWFVKNSGDPKVIQFFQDIVKESTPNIKITVGTSTYKKYGCSKKDPNPNCIIVRTF